MSIAIITWWNNSEREISLISASSVKLTLEQGWNDILHYDLPVDRSRLMNDLESGLITFAFIMIHGAWGEDGQVARLLDLYQIAYQCTTPDVLSLTMNKRRTKCVRRSYDLPVADDFLFQIGDYSVVELDEIIVEWIWYPCVWKELDQWSSQWVHILNWLEDLNKVREKYDSMKKVILLEEFIIGEEVTISILDIDGSPTALPLIHIIPPAQGWFDYENKYNWQTQEIVPSWFPQRIIDSCNDIALQAYLWVWCTKYGRIDGIIWNDWLVLLEINTIPGFTSESLFPKAAWAAWIEFAELLQRLMQ